MGSFPDRLRDRYQPEERLGAGGMGAVWRARDRELGRQVAIKILHDAGPEERRARFEREARLLSELEHPNILAVHDFGLAGDQPYLVTELLEGVPFHRLPGDVDPMPGWRQIGRALDALHAAEVLHRDVKPANAVLTPQGRAVLLDFGLARDEDATALTRTGQVMGTMAYLAPELLRGRPWSPATDWYAWGVGLFVLLEGRLPREGKALEEVFRAAVAGEPLPSPEFLRLQAGTPVRAAIEELLAGDAGARPASWEEVRYLLDGEETSAPPEPSQEPSQEPERPPEPAPRRLPVVPLLLGLLALGGAAVLYRAPGLPVEPAPVAVSQDPGPRQQAFSRLHRAATSLERTVGDAAASPGRKLRGVLDPTLVPRWERHLRALLDWVEALPPEERDLENPATMKLFLTHARDLSSRVRLLPARLVETEAYFKVTGKEIFRPDEDAIRLTMAERELAERGHAAFEEFLARTPSPPPVLRALGVALLSTPEGSDRGPERVGALLEAARAMPAGAPGAGWVVASLVRGLAPPPKVWSCTVKLTALSELDALRRRHGGALRDPTRRELLRALTRGLIRSLDVCGKTLDPPQSRAARTCLEGAADAAAPLGDVEVAGVRTDALIREARIAVGARLP